MSMRIGDQSRGSTPAKPRPVPIAPRSGQPGSRAGCRLDLWCGLRLDPRGGRHLNHRRGRRPDSCAGCRLDPWCRLRLDPCGGRHLNHRRGRWLDPRFDHRRGRRSGSRCGSYFGSAFGFESRVDLCCGFDFRSDDTVGSDAGSTFGYGFGARSGSTHRAEEGRRGEVLVASGDWIFPRTHLARRHCSGSLRRPGCGASARRTSPDSSARLLIGRVSSECGSSFGLARRSGSGFGVRRGSCIGFLAGRVWRRLHVREYPSAWGSSGRVRRPELPHSEARPPTPPGPAASPAPLGPAGLRNIGSPAASRFSARSRGDDIAEHRLVPHRSMLRAGDRGAGND